MTNSRSNGSDVEYKSLVEQSLLGIVVFDNNGIVFANQALGEICGYTLAELHSFSVEQVLGLVHPEDRRAVAQRLARRFEGEQEPERYRIRFVHKNGDVKWMELQSTSVVRDGAPAVQAYIVDVNEQVLAARALRQSESRLRAAIDSLPFDFFALDRDMRYVLQNKVCVEHWGELIGKTPAAVATDPETVELWLDNNRRALAGEVVAEEARFDVDGDPRVAFNIITPFYDEGEIVGIQGVNIDVTDLRRAERDKADVERQLHHAQKMEAVGTLAGGIAHDFNNLLTGIIGSADLLSRQLDGGGSVEQLRRVEMIKSSAFQASRLTRQLLKFARRDKGEEEPVDIGRLIEDTLVMVEHTFDKRIVVERHVEAREPVVRGDPGQLQQVLLNLAVNARDAMPDGGTLRIVVRDASGGAGDGPGFVEVEVSDSGEGMPPEVLGRVFEPFFTTKKSGRGTGMGLAVVFGIVESHGGTIDVSSEEGRGTSFSVRLPRGERVATDLATRPETRHRAAIAGTILLVDDEAVVQKVVSQQLELMGHRVITAVDGAHAVEVYRERGEEIDLVLLDITMPVMGGADCHRAIREIDPRSQFVVITGHGLEETRMRLGSAGVLAILAKPFGTDELATVVDAALKPPI
jgi:PAS domain S-box-containing protein